MADTVLNSDLALERWQRDYYYSFVRESRLKRYSGTDESKPIQFIEDLEAGAGDKIHIGLVGELIGGGVVDSQTLEGAEENLTTYEDHITTHLYRHAVAVPKEQQRKTTVDLLDAGNTQLKSWAMKLLRDLELDVLACCNADGVTTYNGTLYTDDATARNAFLVANADRMLFGAAKSNASSGVFATALSTLDTSADKFTPTILTLALAMAKEISSTPGGQAIRPVKVGEDEDMYICLTGSRAFGDFKKSTEYQAAAKDAAERGPGNPLFHAGDLMWENCIIREVPEIQTMTNAGSVACQPFHLLGAQSVGVAWQSRPAAISDTRDFGRVKAVGIEMQMGVKKLTFNGKAHGQFSGFVACS